MGDVRFEQYLARVREAHDPVRAIQKFDDDEVIAALAAASVERDAYFANVLATEALNRTRRSQAIHESLGQGVLALDGDGCVAWANPAAERLLGVPASDLKGVDLHEVGHIDPPDGTCPVLDCLEGGNTISSDTTQFRRADGTPFPVAVTASATRDREGSIAGVLVLFDDISQRRAAEEALRTRDARLERENDALVSLAKGLGRVGLEDFFRETTERVSRALDVQRASIWLFDDAHEQLFCTDFHDEANGHHGPGPILEVSRYPRYFRALEDQLTLAASDAIGDERTSELAGYLAPPGIGALLDAPIRLRGRVEGVVCHEHVGPPRDWTLDDERFAGSVAALVALAIETDRHERAEREAHESKQRLEAVITGAPLVLFMLDLDGRIQMARGAGLRSLGLTSGEVDGKIACDSFADAPDALDQAHRALRGETFTSRAKIRGVTFEIHWAPLRAGDGRLEGTVGVATDVTGHAQAIQALEEQRRRLESLVDERTRNLVDAYRDLEAFTYRASHDLRGPLRGIDGLTEAIQEDYGTQLGPQGEALLDQLRREARRARSLVDDLLLLSRVAREDMRVEDVDLTRLAQDVIAELRQRDPARQVEVDVEAGVLVKGDAGLLRVALENLIGNAWKFTRDREDARIRVGRRDMPEGEAIFVEDNGAGFDPSQASRLFQPFERLPSAAGFEGTGIGLATVRRIVERHDGRVGATGQPGEGATFWFTLGKKRST